MATKKAEPVEAEIVGEGKEESYDGKYNHYYYHHHHGERGGVFWGLALVAIGGILVAGNFTNVNLWQYFWPALLIVFGLSLVLRSLR